MKKRLIYIVTGIAVSTILVGCGNKTESKEEMPKISDVQSEQSAEAITEKQAEESQNKTSDLKTGQVKQTIKELEDAYEGKVEGLDVSIGTDEGLLQKKWGMPESVTQYKGIPAYQYPEATFLVQETKVVGIALFEKNREFSGVKIGMTPSQIQKVFGPPATIVDNKETNEWKMIYDLTDYQLRIYAKDENSQTVGFILLSTE